MEMVSDRRAKRSRSAAEGEADSFGREEVALAIEKLQEAQDELDKINDEASQEILDIEKKLNETLEPVYARRDEIISGIPDFWSSSLLQHPAIGNMLNMDDREIFKYLDSLNVENLKEDRMGYCIAFNFKLNPYFENTKLTKTFEFFGGALKSTGTNINWKPSKGSSDVSAYMKERNERQSSSNSFFDWFERPSEYTLQKDRDPVAELFREEIWVNPIEHLNNYDYYDDEDDTDDDENEDTGEREDSKEDEEDK